MHEHSTFALPAVDQPADTETGVILAGLDAERLLAGLGLASLADDPTLVTLLVDQVRHGGGELTIDGLLALGARRWRAVRPALAAVGAGATQSGSVRQAWDRATRVVLAADIGAIGPASQAYLAASWLRHDRIDELVTPTPSAAARLEEDDRAVSEVATR
jgi:hypothetical protein